MSAAGTSKQNPPENELRRGERTRTFIAGRIVFRDGTYSQTCIVRDMSEAGARIEIPEGSLIPRRFWFVTSKEDVAHESELVWRTREAAGVKFRQALPLASCNDPGLRYLRQIAAELRPRGA